MAVKAINTTGPVPAADTSTFSLDPGASQTVNVHMGADTVATAGGAKAAWFKDTEGNIMALIQNL